jgi:hypothetical protein
MIRNKWTFEYTASKLSEAAAKKRDVHASKLKWWEEKKAETMKKVAETGIEVQDSVASSYSNTKGNFGPQIRIDSGLQRDLTECQDKIMEHHDAVKDYDGWVQVFTANPEARLSLEHDDYLFFFGA